MKLRLTGNILARTLSMELLKLYLKLISVDNPTKKPKKTDWRQAFLVFQFILKSFTVKTLTKDVNFPQIKRHLAN